MTKQSREELATRLGFLLLSAGCAIGLGNVWRFPYIAGLYGGAYFLATYFFFLLAVGLPIIIMEFAIGRASRKIWAMPCTCLNLSVQNGINQAVSHLSVQPY